MPRPADLTEEQREILTDLLRRPGLTNGQVALMFEDETLRRIAPRYVQKVRRNGGYRADWPRRRLTDVQREVLHRLIREAGPDPRLAPIRARFEGVTGRSISETTTWWHARMVLGIPGPRTNHPPSTRGNP